MYLYSVTRSTDESSSNAVPAHSTQKVGATSRRTKGFGFGDVTSTRGARAPSKNAISAGADLAPSPSTAWTLNMLGSIAAIEALAGAAARAGKLTGCSCSEVAVHGAVRGFSPGDPSAYR